MKALDSRFRGNDGSLHRSPPRKRGARRRKGLAEEPARMTSTMAAFELHAPYRPMGDQPEAIAALIAGLERGDKHQVLLGATGTGKTFTMANVIAAVQRPALVMAHNKTLAAQLYAEFNEFFPDSAVEYFVSYYDYYQPEAYVPRHDLYIEKETEINEEIERMRRSTTTSVVSRRDVVVVASVSCIYGIGSPEAYGRVVVQLRKGERYRRSAVLRPLVESQYERNDVQLRPGAFRVRGDTLEVIPAYDDHGLRISFFDEEVERITEFHPVTGELLGERDEAAIYQAKHYITQEDKLKESLAEIQAELEERLAWLRSKA